MEALGLLQTWIQNDEAAGDALVSVYLLADIVDRFNSTEIGKFNEVKRMIIMPSNFSL